MTQSSRSCHSSLGARPRSPSIPSPVSASIHRFLTEIPTSQLTVGAQGLKSLATGGAEKINVC